MNEVKRYILDFAAYGTEPLYILISALFKKGLCSTGLEAIKPLLELTAEGLVEWHYTSDQPDSRYEKLNSVSEGQLKEYVARHEQELPKKDPLPQEGGEYYITTTDRGYTVVESQ